MRCDARGGELTLNKRVAVVCLLAGVTQTFACSQWLPLELVGGKVKHVYPNTQPGAFLWYHDHGLGITRLNVYASIAAAYLLNDPNDTVDAALAQMPLLPLVIQDRMFYPERRGLGSLILTRQPRHPIGRRASPPSQLSISAMSSSSTARFGHSLRSSRGVTGCASSMGATHACSSYRSPRACHWPSWAWRAITCPATSHRSWCANSSSVRRNGSM